MFTTRENKSCSKMRVVKKRLLIKEQNASKERGLYPILWRRKMLMHTGLNL